MYFLQNFKVLQATARNDDLVRRNAAIEELLSKNSQKVRELESLKDGGLGLSELKQLHNLIEEISREAGMPTEHNAAVKKFFKDLEEHYDDYLNLGKKVAESKSELRKLSEALDLASLGLKITPEIVKMIQSLVRAGIKKDDIEHISRMIIENRLPRPENSRNSSVGKIPARGNHLESENQGEKTVTQKSHNLSEPVSDLRNDNSIMKVGVVAESKVDTCNTDDPNLQQLVAHFYGNHTSCQDGRAISSPEALGGNVELSNHSKIPKKLPPFPPGIRKKRSARFNRSLRSVTSVSKKHLVNCTSYPDNGRRLNLPDLDASPDSSPPSPNSTNPTSRDNEMPMVVEETHGGVQPSTRRETSIPVINLPSANQSKLDNGWNNFHLELTELIMTNNKSVIDDSLRRIDCNRREPNTQYTVKNTKKATWL